MAPGGPSPPFAGEDSEGASHRVRRFHEPDSSAYLVTL